MPSSSWTFTLPGFEIDSIQEEQNALHVRAHSLTAEALCPTCHHLSQRLHSVYHRVLKDLPLADQQVYLHLTVRRFRCLNLQCGRQTFVESLATVAAKYAQRTQRFTGTITTLGLALGGEAGHRVAKQLRLPISADTLLRLLRHTSVTIDTSTIRIIGIDDWAFKRRLIYGTLIVDLEHHRPIELLADRTAETLARWLKQHPSIQKVSRDRSSEYARGIQLGAPHAQQIADRWHLFINLMEVLERILTDVRMDLQQLPWRVNPTQVPPILRREKRAKNETTTRAARREIRRQQYEQVQRLYQAGVSLRQIAKSLNLHRATTRKYARATSFPEWAPHHRTSGLTPFEPYLCQRWQAGCRNAAQLWREVRARGYPGTLHPVVKWVNLRRETPAPTDPRSTRDSRPMLPSTESQAHSLPSAKRIAWLLVKTASQLNEREQTLLKHLHQSPIVTQCWKLAQRFLTILRQRLPHKLRPWLKACYASGIPEFIGFADGLTQDRAAIQAALSQEWSNGQLEGQVNRLKCIKRQMYGRAKFDLLRIRVLSRA